jgi:hypothetical protein
VVVTLRAEARVVSKMKVGITGTRLKLDPADLRSRRR